MNSFNYILSFDPGAISPNGGQTHVFISQNRDITSWYYAFIIKSPQTLQALNQQLMQHFASAPYILTYAQDSWVTGSLPPSIWQWFNGVQNPFLPSN